MQTYKINPKVWKGLNNQVFVDDNHISACALTVYDPYKDILCVVEWRDTL
jgi:hypothetical protein